MWGVVSCFEEIMYLKTNSYSKYYHPGDLEKLIIMTYRIIVTIIAILNTSWFRVLFYSDLSSRIGLHPSPSRSLQLPPSYWIVLVEFYWNAVAFILIMWDFQFSQYFFHFPPNFINFYLFPDYFISNFVKSRVSFLWFKSFSFLMFMFYCQSRANNNNNFSGHFSMGSYIIPRYK